MDSDQGRTTQTEKGAEHVLDCMVVATITVPPSLPMGVGVGVGVGVTVSS